MTVKALIVVTGRVGWRIAIRYIKGCGGIIYRLSWRGPLGKSSHIDIWLKGRAGLAIGQSDIKLPINRAVIVVDAAQHRDDRARVEVNQHFSCVGYVMGVADLGDVLLHDGENLLLECDIDC